MPLARREALMSKEIENHAAAIALGYFAYNFIKIHSTLRFTPATISEWISIVSAPTRPACTPAPIFPDARSLMERRLRASTNQSIS